MDFQVGQAVQNPTFGLGTVSAISGENITVVFDDGQEKMVKPQYLQPSNHTPKPLEDKTPKKRQVQPIIIPTNDFQEYLATTGCYIHATVPPQAKEKFDGDYEEITGTRPGTSGYTLVTEKTWALGLCLFFKRPSPTSNVDVPVEAKAKPGSPNILQLCNNHFIKELFKEGFSLGRNYMDANSMGEMPMSEPTTQTQLHASKKASLVHKLVDGWLK